MKKLGITIMASWLLVPAATGAESIARENFNGMWMPDQGVLWDTSVKAGEAPRAPFTSAYAEIYKAARAAAASGKPIADRTTACLPAGVPRIMTAPFPMEFILTANTLYTLHEYMSQVRRIYIGGSGPEPLGEPSFNGHSTAQWNGEELHVSTVDLRGPSVLDTTGVPHSDVLKVQERMRLLAPNKLEIVTTLIDEKAYTRPWAVTRTYTKNNDDRILEYVCEENNRNRPNDDGTTGFVGSQR